TTNLPDYVGLAFAAVCWGLIVAFVKPFHALFFVNDVRISFPFAEVERVSVPWNIIYALFVPLSVLLLVNFFARSSAAKHEATYLAFFISIALSQLLTDILKNAVGRPRPDLLSRCVPSASATTTKPVDITACTAPDSRVLQDGWRSFPSGHSSFSFAGLGFLALFLSGQLGAFRLGTRDLGRALVCFTPLVGAALIAISRCEDYRHDVYDVCVGSAIGMTVAYWSYRRHWPRLSSHRCDEPYPRGTIAARGREQQGDLAAAAGWQRVRDEEEGAVDVGYEMDTLRENRG
ncbi:unnamed protein product, partial [Clonostachys byssicola]